MAVIGLDLGGTKLTGALFGQDGSIQDQSGTLLEGRAGNAVGQLIAGQLRRLLNAAESRGCSVQAVGVSVPGIAHHGGDRVWAPNIAGWDSYPLQDELAQELTAGCLLSIESDRACSILGEVSRGAARGCRNAVFLAVGTGIGAGILMDGRILRGAHDIAGAIGWMALDRPYRDVYDRCGGFESHASGAGIARVAREYLDAGLNDQGPLATLARDKITAHEVFDAFQKGDSLAARVIANAVQCWGMALANVVSLLNPEVVIFGGGMFGPAAGLLDRIIREAKQWAQPVSFSKVSVVASEMGAEACLYGTGELARRAILED